MQVEPGTSVIPRPIRLDPLLVVQVRPEREPQAISCLHRVPPSNLYFGQVAVEMPDRVRLDHYLVPLDPYDDAGQGGPDRRTVVRAVVTAGVLPVLRRVTSDPEVTDDRCLVHRRCHVPRVRTRLQKSLKPPQTRAGTGGYGAG